MAIKVLIIDDSALMRQLLTRILESDPKIAVAGTASDAFAAREKIIALNPDVLTLDVEMPRMDGISFLEILMKRRPMPVVMISSLTTRGAETTLRALSLGAVDFVAKPTLDIESQTVEHADEIIAKVKAAAGAKVRFTQRCAKAVATPVKTNLALAAQKIVAIGASTGGTEALKEVLAPLPPDFPGTVIVQHMPEAFTCKFAERLNALCNIKVREARDGDLIEPGTALLAPGGHQMSVVRVQKGCLVHVYRGEPVNRHMPSVDVLFSSCARELGANGIGIILTGMGADGARGLLEMRRAEAFTIAQDAASSIVFGMPKEAIQLGAAGQVLPLSNIPEALIKMFSSPCRHDESG